MDAMFFIVLGATLVSFLLTLAFGRFVIPMLRALHAGQSIREVGPQWHNSKAGTPTMGGIMFIAAILLCTVGFGWKSMVENADYTHLYVLGLALCYGLVGFADDFVKVKFKRNLGLTAVFAYNDSMAAGALTTLKDNGIVVPQHLSLIGFDDIPISRYTDPQLTTVRYPVMSMAKLATELALLGAAGKLDREATHCFMPTLVRRHSVAQRQTVGPITN